MFQISLSDQTPGAETLSKVSVLKRIFILGQIEYRILFAHQENIEYYSNT